MKNGMSPRKLGALGFEVAFCRTAEPEPDGTGQTKAT
jgi:hypothetical protein